MQIVYDIRSGIILSGLPKDQDILTYYHHYPEDFKSNLGSVIINDPPRPLGDYKVVDGELIRLEDVELHEISMYGRILLGEERFEVEMLNKLKPSYEEIQKAENTIEILELLSEVL